MLEIFMNLHFFVNLTLFLVDIIFKQTNIVFMAQRDEIEARREKILAYINEEGKADVSTLAELCSSTDYTIRRDLIELEKNNFVTRTHGGAIKKEREKPVWQTTSTYSRLEKNRDLKESIAVAASDLIGDNESIMIDSGSTTQIFAEHIKNKHNLLSVTTSPRIAEIMLESEDSHVVLIGGELSRGTYMVTGSDAEEHLRKYYVDKCIISVTGADTTLGCYAAIPNEASLKKLMIEHSRECILLIDSSKFRRKAFVLAFTFDSVQTIVTDSKIDKKVVEKLREKGINVIVAQ